MRQFTKNLALQYEMTGKQLQPAMAAMIVQAIENAGITEEQAIDALGKHVAESDRPALPVHIIKLVNGNPEQAATDRANDAYGRFMDKLAGYNPDLPRRCLPLDPVTETVVRNLFGGWAQAQATLTEKDLQDGTTRAQFRNAWQALENQAQANPLRLVDGPAPVQLAAVTAIANQKRLAQ